LSYCIFFDTYGDDLHPVPLLLWKSAKGREPVRDWLNELSREDKRTIGQDIAKVQFGWPVGMTGMQSWPARTRI
jgi:hypothetical protein